ncbi:hypothetical protein PBY51_014041 [Eleginops maclovinus]|uniref:Uncharacterized protein n=1 Tax=Eleginops maclovinus TaxID=56733 RepID=A0AAN7ZY53_ELEMC|nr:hypothetical protein PBY51_014041 [Eleginops maclovinus]
MVVSKTAVAGEGIWRKYFSGVEAIWRWSEQSHQYVVDPEAMLTGRGAVPLSAAMYGHQLFNTGNEGLRKQVSLTGEEFRHDRQMLMRR